MTIGKSSLSLIVCLAVGGIVALAPKPVSGQGYAEDFMFHQPKVTVTFNIGYGMPAAGSDLFTWIQDEFTLEKSDFGAPAVGGGVSIFMNERVDLAFEFSYSKSTTWSEYTDFVGGDDLPIEQETKFTRVPVTASFRYFLMDRGRGIGSLSWIPTTWAPYVGGGGGRMFYEFSQTGEFINFQSDDLPIYNDSLLSEGWAWVGHVFGGVHYALSPQWVITGEARYSLADADLDRNSFGGFEPIDLSGFQGTIGFGVRF